MGTADGSVRHAEARDRSDLLVPDRAGDVPVVELRIVVALRLVARGLMAYGLASIVMGVLALIATLVVAVQLDASAARLVDRVGRVGVMLDTTATALDQGVASTERFATALDELAPTLTRTTASLRAGSATLGELANAADRISLLGNRPFASLTTSLTTTARELEQLAGSIETNATTLAGSKAALDRMAAVLPPVAERLRSLRTNLEPDVRAVLDDVQRLIPLAGAAFAAWLGLPGAGAFLLGRRLRRALLVDTGSGGPPPRGRG